MKGYPYFNERFELHKNEYIPDHEIKKHTNDGNMDGIPGFQDSNVDIQKEDKFSAPKKTASDIIIDTLPEINEMAPLISSSNNNNHTENILNDFTAEINNINEINAIPEPEKAVKITPEIMLNLSSENISEHSSDSVRNDEVITDVQKTEQKSAADLFKEKYASYFEKFDKIYDKENN